MQRLNRNSEWPMATQTASSGFSDFTTKAGQNLAITCQIELVKLELCGESNFLFRLGGARNVAKAAPACSLLLAGDGVCGRHPVSTFTC